MVYCTTSITSTSTSGRSKYFKSDTLNKKTVHEIKILFINFITQNTKPYFCLIVFISSCQANSRECVFNIGENRRTGVQSHTGARARGPDHKTYRPLIARMLLAIYPPINPDPPETFMAIYFPQILNEIFLIFIRPVVPLLKTIGFMTAHVTGP